MDICGSVIENSPSRAEQSITKGSSMTNYRSLRHTKWECKYHVMFIPKCRRKVLYGTLRQELGRVFRELAQQKESAIYVARNFADRRRNFVGQHFWARRYFVSTLGRDEEVIRDYIQQQEEEDRRRDQQELFNR